MDRSTPETDTMATTLAYGGHKTEGRGKTLIKNADRNPHFQLEA